MEQSSDLCSAFQPAASMEAEEEQDEEEQDAQWDGQLHQGG